MSVTVGDVREKWAWDVWQKAESYANELKGETEPFYVVFAAKSDRSQDNAFRQTFKFYRQRPPALIGLLVWYVDNQKGIFELVPELSIPPDVPIDPTLMSKDRSDELPTVMETGRRMGVLLS